jgi:hypothetical protein
VRPEQTDATPTQLKMINRPAACIIAILSG